MTEQELVSQIDSTRALLDSLQEQLRELRIDKSGVHVGDIVMAKARVRGRNNIRSVEPVEAKVTQIRPWREGKPWVTAVLRTKSGAWGRQQRNLFDDWEKLA